MKKILGGIICFLLFIPFMTSAQGFGETPPTTVTIRNLPTNVPTTFNLWIELIDTVLSWLIVFGVVFAVILLIIAGIMYITAAGNAERASTAVRIIIYTVIGLAVLLLAWGIVRTLATFIAGQEVLT